MSNPQFIAESPLALADVKVVVHTAEKRDGELNFLSNKVKEYLEHLMPLAEKKREELYAKLVALNLTRLKEEHFCKIIDFLPKNLDELKVVLQSYPLSLSKKDQESIVAVIQEFV
ncbi:MAG TPA: hypothetical protein VJA18_03760 [Candidatus Nanoarchaeia archaeon]|nr:hypothetical protein [Candidatus Nanoarchaeia archaeon]